MVDVQPRFSTVILAKEEKKGKKKKTKVESQHNTFALSFPKTKNKNCENQRRKL